MKGLTSEEVKALVRSVGTHRGHRALSPLEVSELLTKAIGAGETRKSCGETLNLGQTLLATFLRLRNLTPEIQHLADWGTSTSASIAFSSLAGLSRLSTDEQVEASTAILRHHLTGTEVVQLVQIARRSEKPIGNCIADVLRLRPEVEVRHLLVGAITSEDLRRGLSDATQRERDQLIQEVLEEMLEGRAEVKCRLGVSNFTVMSDTNILSLLELEADDLEERVNDALAKKGLDNDAS